MYRLQRHIQRGGLWGLSPLDLGKKKKFSPPGQIHEYAPVPIPQFSGTQCTWRMSDFMSRVNHKEWDFRDDFTVNMITSMVHCNLKYVSCFAQPCVWLYLRQKKPLLTFSQLYFKSPGCHESLIVCGTPRTFQLELTSVITSKLACSSSLSFWINR